MVAINLLLWSYIIFLLLGKGSFMSKLKTSLLISAIVLSSSAVYAGGPSVEPMSQNNNLPLFATVEGGYTWNAFGNTTVNGVTASKSDKGVSARAAVGATHYSTSNPNVSYTAEGGWGYYGKTEYISSSSGVDAKDYIYGIDFLAGVNYAVNNMFDLFVKAGALVQNIRINRTTDLSRFVAGGTVTGTDTERKTVSSVIPEIKLGGVYNINEAWGISLAYMHAFGNNVSMSVSKTHGADSATSNTTITGAPVTLNNVMLGLRYRFS